MWYTTDIVTDDNKNAIMKEILSVRTIVFILLVFQVGKTHVESYNIKCPAQGNWKLHAKAKCSSVLKYFCLFSDAELQYVEGCQGPDWDRKGRKRIFSGYFTRGNCSLKRYQPFVFQTSESMSDCVYTKFLCSEEGQIIYQTSSSAKDRTCRCDNANNYAFIKTPRNINYCIPSEEDCSCYIRSCPVKYSLSTGYECIRSGYNENQILTDSNIKYKKVIQKPQVKEKKSSLHFERRSRTTAVLFCCICLLIVIVEGWFTIYSKGKNTGALTMAEINFLRMIYLLYSVACPVVQIKLDNENKLWENRMNMHEQYQETETSSHGHHLGLSYKGETVKSDNFENRLSMILVRIVDKIKMGDAYPKTSDVSDRSMLSRLKYIKNKAAQRLKADLSEDKFNHKWDKIKKAVRTLAQTLNLENDKDNTRLIDNLKVIIKQIPEGCHLHQRDNKYTVLTTEENNFLVAFYVLATIVHPLINTKCTNRILGIDMTFRKKRLQYWEDDYEITKQDKQQHHSTKKEESRNLNILRVNTRKEDEKDHQLEVIIAIQREIEQNSSGILNENRLREILKCTREAVLQLGGEWNEEKILSLQNEIIF